MFKQRIAPILLVGLVLAGAVRVSAQTVVAASKQDELLQVLKSADSTRQDKAAACRLLTFVATIKAVPVLAPLLGDPQMNHMARYALELIDDPLVDDALLEALVTLEGKPRVGVIGSIGVRGDKRAVAPLSKLLAGDNMTAQAAARALGSIGDVAAARALNGALARSKGDTKLSICEGLFRCAENLGGNEALAIYNTLSGLDEPHQVRAGGLRGAILTHKDGLALLERNLTNKDYIMFSAAVQASSEMPGTEVTTALANQLGKLSADSQVLILGTLAIRGDKAATSAVSRAATTGEKAVRIAAIEAMPAIGDTASVRVLADLMGDSDSDISKVARASLAAMEGRGVDQTIMTMLSSGNADTQLMALDLMERRRMDDIAPALMQAVKDNDESVRAASIRMLGELDDEVGFDVLVKLLLESKSAAEVRAAERALSGRCARSSRPSASKVTIIKAVYGASSGSPSADVTAKVGQMVKDGALEIAASNGNFGDAAPGIVKKLDIIYTVDGVRHSGSVAENQSLTLAGAVTPKAYIEALYEAQAKAPAAKQLALLRVLRGTNDSKALEAVRSAAKSRDSNVRDEAISMLCNWPSVDVLADVQELSRSGDRKVRILAVRGMIRLIPLQDASNEDKMADFRKVQKLIERDEEKRLLLAAMPTVPSAEALSTAISYVDDAATKNEACFSAVAIANEIATRNKAEVTDAMQKVLKATDNADVKKGAMDALNKAK